MLHNIWMDGRRYRFRIVVALCTTCLAYVLLAACLSKTTLMQNIPRNVRFSLNIDRNITRTDDVLKQVAGTSTYILSAIFYNTTTSELSLNIFAGSSSSSLKCCLAFQDGSVFLSGASVAQEFHQYMYLSYFLEYFNPPQYVAKQIKCSLPMSSALPTHVTLTANGDCPLNRKEYVDIVHPDIHPTKLAICAKVAYNDSLNTQQLVEWFELQMLLGVDKILLFVMDLPKDVRNVLDYYREIGMLTTVPYAIPGEPKRSFMYGNRSYPQFLHDEQLAIFDCLDRLSGYMYVAALDLDEFIIPRSNIDLKGFIQEMTRRHPDAAGFQFHVQFHITDWVSVNNGTETRLLRYLDSTLPRWECQKYVYSPHRITHARTHEFFPRDGYKRYTIPPNLASIHHFRSCPVTWSDCYTMPRMRDYITLRFASDLKQRIEESMKTIYK